MTIDDLELTDVLLQRAVHDARELGDRYVPMALPGGGWCVVDGWLEVAIETGLGFAVALNKAEEFSRLQKIHSLEAAI